MITNRQMKNFIGKLRVWGMAIMIVSLAAFPFPVQAADQWSQYAKVEKSGNIYLGAFSSPKSVAIDSKGNVYVADTSNHRIQKLTVSTGEWSQWQASDGGFGSELGEFSSPQGLAIDKHDNLYVADSSNHRIQKFDPQANEWSEIGDGEGTALGQFKDPKGVAVDGVGNVYVADSRNDRIQKLDVSAGGAGVWSEWKRNSGGAGSALGEFNRPARVSVDSSGNVYVADTGNHRIQKLDVSAGGTGVWSEWTDAGSALGVFSSPTDVVVDSRGNAYAADSRNHRILKLDASTSEWSEWKKSGGGAGGGLGEFYSPGGLALDSGGNLYVADTLNDRIQKLTVATGKWSEWIYQGPVPGTELGEFSYPSAVAVDRSQNVYVADFDNNRLQKLDASTDVWEEIGDGQGSGLGQFDGPTDVALDSDGNLYVADMHNHRIQKLDVSAGIWSEWKKNGGGQGSGLGEFAYPSGVAVDGSGNLYVADNNHRIQRLDAANNSWSEWKKPGGGSGSGLGEFKNPYSVEVDSKGNVYVADSGNHRIQMLDAKMGFWWEWKKTGGGRGNNLGEFDDPNSVAIDSDGNIYVADTGNHRIQKLTVSTGVWSEWKRSGGGPGGSLGEFNSPLSVAVDSNGIVYVAEFENHRIQKLQSDLTVPPGQPTDVKAIGSDGRAKVSFQAPQSDGGSAITGYTVTAWLNGQATAITATGKSSPITIDGLTNGTAYTFKVQATNRAGNSVASAASNAVIPSASNGGSPSTPEAAVVLVNGKLEYAGTLKVTSVNSQQVATITLDPTKLAEKLAKEGQHAVVTIPVNTRSDVVIGELDGQMVSQMESQQAVLEVKTERATYRLPAELIDIRSIVAQIGSSVALNEIRVQVEIALPKAPAPGGLPESEASEISMVIPPLDFKVRALHQDTAIEVTAFKAYVERTIALPDGVDPNKITTGVVLEPDGTLRHVPTKVVQRDGKYVAQVNSLTNSIYALIWHPLEFQDVAQHWAKRSVNEMGSRMVISGVGNSSFRPDQAITRAEFAAILVRGLGLPQQAGAVSFPDVAEKDWFAGAIGTAAKYDLISGFEDGAFRPNDQLTREQAMTILSRAMALTELKTKSAPDGGRSVDAFTDAGEISGWAKRAISDCLQYGLISGRGGAELAPKATITRAEVAVIVQKLLQQSDLI
ncbi:S-layer homology domain-containing protein [Tumebacillus lipolyticus]|uniref:S-layer homology domain-containing protein n=1 Tax=Tumebacillus lipolyticus TaxID=1280370 RepID=A0ABW4ZXV7_9BACL